MGKYAAIPLQADFVNNIVLPHFYLFAPIVYAAEVLTGVSLMLGVFVRLFAVIGALQILNLWLGLYNAPNEWPWRCLRARWTLPLQHCRETNVATYNGCPRWVEPGRLFAIRRMAAMGIF